MNHYPKTLRLNPQIQGLKAWESTPDDKGSTYVRDFLAPNPSFSWILCPDLNGTWTGLPSCNYIKLERDSDSLACLLTFCLLISFRILSLDLSLFPSVCLIFKFFVVLTSVSLLRHEAEETQLSFCICRQCQNHKLLSLLLLKIL